MKEVASNAFSIKYIFYPFFWAGPCVTGYGKMHKNSQLRIQTSTKN